MKKRDIYRVRMKADLGELGVTRKELFFDTLEMAGKYMADHCKARKDHHVMAHGDGYIMVDGMRRVNGIDEFYSLATVELIEEYDHDNS